MQVQAAISQPAPSYVAGSIADRAIGYGIPGACIDGNDLDVVMRELGDAVDRARRGEGPTYLVANTYRFRGHSMSDAMKYRTKEELEKARQRDPIILYERRLRDRGLIDDAWMESSDAEVRAIVDDAVKFADASPPPELSELYTDILAENYPLEK